ncbi:phytanoyl-CoA dioxygenase family protein [Paenibacillus lutrae]|uniref:Phytanoyl-CoA dioxygenase n=1 Tax=Paenibacillus lutrae TaxID=2078573 RepID=A0A7X3JYF6_9BACL|nr:phytanoyl-CoA dioxygenase family protein [Paenibacillus lutrae]MVO98865.1 phytanoyl-CoA dioxygenase [Paenibacillus lutrae]
MSSPYPGAMPDLADSYYLDDSLLEQYRVKGHICLRQAAFVDEISAYRPHIIHAVQNYIGDRSVRPHRQLYMNVWEENEQVRRFVFARRFAKMAAELMGVSGVRLYLDQASFIEPGASITPWHRADAYMLELDPDRIITMWMPLVDVPEPEGPVSYITGSHLLEHSPSKNSLLEAKRAGLPEESCGPLRLGDAVFHSGRILHGAPGNNGVMMREMMTITYFAEDACIIDPEDKSGRAPHLRRLFSGIGPGQPAAGPLTPVLYSNKA